MPGPDRRSRSRPPARVPHPTRGRPPQPLAGKAAGKGPAKPEGAPVDPASVPEAPKRPVDGDGRPYITLAQFLKWKDLADTGGAAKVLARSKTITVNSQAEDRPGRKLHVGDTVIVAGKAYTVSLDP